MEPVRCTLAGAGRPLWTFRAEHGVSLIDAAVALGILGVVVVAVAGFYPGASAVARGAGNMTAATYLASSLLEEVSSRSFGDVTQANYSGLSDVTLNGVVFSRTVTVTTNYKSRGANCMKQVDVTVGWTQGTRQKSVLLSTLLLNREASIASGACP